MLAPCVQYGNGTFPCGGGNKWGMLLELMSMGGLLSSGGSAFHWCSQAALKVDVKL